MKRFFSFIIVALMLCLICSCSSQSQSVAPTQNADSDIRKLIVERLAYSALDCAGWCSTYNNSMVNGYDIEMPRLRVAASLEAMTQLFVVLDGEVILERRTPQGTLWSLTSTFITDPEYYEPLLDELSEIFLLIEQDYSNMNTYERIDDMLEYFKG